MNHVTQRAHSLLALFQNLHVPNIFEEAKLENVLCALNELVN